MSNQNREIFDFGAHKLLVDNIIAKTFDQAFMSNSKWRKCFDVLNNFGEEEAPEYGRRPQRLQAKWMFVGDREREYLYTTPHPDSLMERYIDSRFWLGPRYYKEIEWLEIPKIAKPYGTENLPITFYEQALQKIEEALAQVGKFEIQWTNEGLKIYGYRQTRT